MSDLHFGRVDERLVDPLLEAIEGLTPHLVAISGDLTQHARAAEFMEARRLMERIARPVLVVPGNHDLSFYNPIRRVVERLKLYKRAITPDLEPVFADDEIHVLGLNTARVPLFRGGRFSRAQLAKVESHMAAAKPGALRVLVTHHPFDLPAAYARTELVRGARDAAHRLIQSVDLLLAGHMHASHSGATAARYDAGGQSAVFVQAGTALSLRVRGEPNSFNAIQIGGGAVRVEVWSFEGGRFRVSAVETFRRVGEAWGAA